MKQKIERIITALSPILGAGAVGVCPLCWVGSASLLTYLGLGSFIAIWPWIVIAFLGVGLVGFALDYRSHKNFYPVVLLITGGALLYIGRYTSLGGAGFGGWQIWGPGAILIIIAVAYNKRQFKNKHHNE